MNDLLLLEPNYLFGKDQEKCCGGSPVKMIAVAVIHGALVWRNAVSVSEENGTCRHIRTPTLKLVCKKGGLCAKNW